LDQSNKIEFSAEKAMFLETIASTFASLVDVVNIGISLDGMEEVKWQLITSTGDQSPYLTKINELLTVNIPILRKQIKTAGYFKMFCDKFVESFLNKFNKAMFEKCKYMSETGAEQLLVDIYSLKTILGYIPSMGLPEKAPPTAAFLKIIERGILKIEKPVKLVAASHESQQNFLKTFVDLYGTDRCEADLTAILNMKVTTNLFTGTELE
jgi:hypothetical protein